MIKVVAAYVRGLQFSQEDGAGNPIRSSFDVFLEINGLPQQPQANESPGDYSRRLLQLVQARKQNDTLRFVTSNPNTADGRFQFHTQAFVFRREELEGLKIFFTEPQTHPPSAAELTQGRIGNCVVCHAALTFTDFQVHNTGITQREYDNLHGVGQFARLAIPSLVDPLLTDLGLWNIFANADFPEPQEKIRTLTQAIPLDTSTHQGLWWQANARD